MMTGDRLGIGHHPQDGHGNGAACGKVLRSERAAFAGGRAEVAQHVDDEARFMGDAAAAAHRLTAEEVKSGDCGRGRGCFRMRRSAAERQNTPGRGGAERGTWGRG